MTWNSTMSSGYSSLEEDSEEYFFTARTSFFRKPLGKVSESKVTLFYKNIKQLFEALFVARLINSESPVVSVSQNSI